jgi:hypothetical protein
VYTALNPAGSGESIRGICTTGNYLYAAIGADDFGTFRIDRCAIGNQLMSFGFEGIDAAADIDTAHDTVDITVPPDADLLALTPVITAQEGAAVALESTDFTAPVTCTVTSGVLGARSYTITVHQDDAGRHGYRRRAFIRHNRDAGAAGRYDGRYGHDCLYPVSGGVYCVVDTWHRADDRAAHAASVVDSAYGGVGRGRRGAGGCQSGADA